MEMSPRPIHPQCDLCSHRIRRRAALTGPTLASVIDGVATFEGLQIFAPGSYSLRAVDGGLFSTSSIFNVGSAPI